MRGRQCRANRDFSAPRASQTWQQVHTYAERRAAFGGEQESLKLLKVARHGAFPGKTADDERVELAGLPSRGPCRRQEQQRDLHEHDEREECGEGDRDDSVTVETYHGGHDGGEGRVNEPGAKKRRTADQRLAEQQPVVPDRADEREASDDGGRGHGHAGEEEEQEEPGAAQCQAAAAVATAGRAHCHH
jgi:hypothetical protein